MAGSLGRGCSRLSGRRTPLLPALLLALLPCVCTINNPFYDLLVLSEDWNPSSCTNASCNGTPMYGAFTVFSLSPANRSTSLEAAMTKDQRCVGPVFWYEQMPLPKGRVQQLNCFFASNEGENSDLWGLLWNSSGKCSDLSIDSYFDFLISQYNEFNINEVLVAAGGFSAPQVDRGELLAALKAAWGVDAWVTCDPDSRDLLSVSICFPRPNFPWEADSMPLGGFGTNSTAVDCPWDPLGEGPSGLECNGSLNIRPGQRPPDSCDQWFPAILPGAIEGEGGPQEPSSGGGLSGGAIAGIVVGALLGVGIALCVLVAWRRRRRRSVAAPSPRLPGTFPAAATAFDSAKGDLEADYLDFDVMTTAGTAGGPASSAGATRGSASVAVPARRGPGCQQKQQQGSNGDGSKEEEDEVLSLMRTLSGSKTPAAHDAALRRLSGQSSSGEGLGLDLQPGPREDSSLTPTWSHRYSSSDSSLWEVPYSQLTLCRRVGEGAFGRVFVGEWHSTPVAVKLLLDQGQIQDSGSLAEALSRPSPMLLRLRDEADIMFALRHPNVVQIMGMCSVPPCLVTEYCARGSLCECLREARRNPAAAALLTWRRRLAMAYDATKGMIYLHSRTPPIVHRDLKSPNLLVDKDWNCKVADFNLSKWMDGAPHSTDEAMNPRWLAPEVLEGRPATPAADAFAFGVVLWELLTWQLPWHTDGQPSNHWGIVMLVTSGQRLPVPPPEELPGPHHLSPVVLQEYLDLMQLCWAQDPGDRPTFAEIAARLRDLIRQVLPATHSR